jgi:hypothetical protein
MVGRVVCCRLLAPFAHFYSTFYECQLYLYIGRDAVSRQVLGMRNKLRYGIASTSVIFFCTLVF